MHALKQTFKLFILLAVIAVYVGGGVVLILNREPAMAEDMIWTEHSASLYRKDPDTYRVWKLRLDPNYTSSGTFFVSNLRYAETANEYVLTVRFNKSTLKYCAQDYNLAEDALSYDCFTYQLRDKDGNIYPVGNSVHLEKSRHHYFRLVFTGIPMEKLEELTFAAQYDGEDYGIVPLWNELSAKTEYSLDRDELPH